MKKVMNRKFDIRTPFLDFFMINLSWYLYFLFRVRSGVVVVGLEPDFWLPMFFVWLYWFVIFLFFGLYRPWHAASRTDEVTTLMKAVGFGCVILSFVIFVDDAGVVKAKISSRMLILVYWGIMVFTTGTGRVLYRTARRRLLAAGVGLRNTLIVGWNDKAKNLYDLVLLHPALGYRVIGFVKLDRRKSGIEYKGSRLLGSVDDLPSLIERRFVKDILIALESADHDKLLDVISH